MKQKTNIKCSVKEAKWFSRPKKTQCVVFDIVAKLIDHLTWNYLIWTEMKWFESPDPIGVPVWMEFALIVLGAPVHAVCKYLFRYNFNCLKNPFKICWELLKLPTVSHYISSTSTGSKGWAYMIKYFNEWQDDWDCGYTNFTKMCIYYRQSRFPVHLGILWHTWSKQPAVVSQFSK